MSALSVPEDTNALLGQIERTVQIIAASEGFSQSDARKISNVARNRYDDGLPWNHTRVLLDSGDYINASHVNLPVGEALFGSVLTQGPLNHTTVDFWEMVWQLRSQAIIMLCEFVEDGRKKCAEYFPDGLREMRFDKLNMRVRHMGSTQLAGWPVVRREFLLTKVGASEEDSYDSLSDDEYEPRAPQSFAVQDSSDESDEEGERTENRTVFQYHYRDIEDGGVPRSVHQFVSFMMTMLEMRLKTPKFLPIVHCSAGLGRSGFYMMIEVLMGYILRGMPVNDELVSNLLVAARLDRDDVVQTKEQYEFIVRAINHYIDMRRQ